LLLIKIFPDEIEEFFEVATLLEASKNQAHEDGWYVALYLCNEEISTSPHGANQRKEARNRDRMASCIIRKKQQFVV
jgi:hypothetical protein